MTDHLISGYLVGMTEQTAILTSLLMGRGVKDSGPRAVRAGRAADMPRTLHPNTAATLALQAFLGPAPNAYCRAWVVHRDPRDRKTPAKQRLWKWLWQRNPTKAFGRLANSAAPDIEMHFVASPVDGIRDLLQGFGGALSVLAGGPPGSFLPTTETDLDGESHPDRYFLLAVSPKITGGASIFPAQVNTSAGGPKHFIDVMLQERVIDKIRKGAGKARSELTIGTMSLKHSSPLRPFLSPHARMRTFQGSSVAAAIATFYPQFGIDAFVGIIRRTPAILISTAARAIGGFVHAIPVQDSTVRQKHSALLIKKNERVCRAEFFVPGKDVFFIGTGITENLLLKGVRFRAVDQVSTHTLVLNSRDRSQRFFQHHHDLREKSFFLPDGRRRYEDITRNFAEAGRF